MIPTNAAAGMAYSTIRSGPGCWKSPMLPAIQPGEPRVHTHVLIPDAQLIPLEDLSTFLTSIAALLSAGTGDEYAESRRKTEAALDQAHEAKRAVRRTGVSTVVVVEVSLLGSAATYMTLRERWEEEVTSRVSAGSG